MNSRLQLLSALALVGFLSACTTTVGTGDFPSYSAKATVAELFEQASQKSGEKADGLYLAAADLAYQQQQAKQALDILNKINFANLAINQQIFAYTLQAEAAVANKQAALALTAIEQPVFDQLSSVSTKLQIRAQLARASTLQANNKPLAAMRERVFIAPLLSGKQAQKNHEAIWAIAEKLPSVALAKTGEQDLVGWLELAKLIQQPQTLELQQATLRQWIANNPQHPAARNLPKNLATLLTLEAQNYQNIALVLPVRGDNQYVFDAIRDGFLAAHYQQAAQGTTVPKLHLYDSAQIGSMDALYQQALKDQVQFVVGPWEKEQVKLLTQKQSLPIPTLALNYSDSLNSYAAELYQYGLAAEDEAKGAARLAWDNGHTKAAIVTPQGDWGNRVQQAFQQAFTDLGGQVVGSTAITRNMPVTTQLDSFGSKLEQANFVFIAAPTQYALGLKQTLAKKSINIPIFATSAINPGNLSADTIKQLDGIIFCEVPWLLNTSNAVYDSVIREWPQSLGSLGRFYAMGIDAYQLTGRLAQLKTMPNSQIPGLSGSLSLTTNQRIERQLLWAAFVNGQIRPLVENEFN
ncbi:penicillin-binding protein activator [Pseudomonas sp. F1_0610]|uniref:penicillin-binding protein activator n=1 Tax=Pseudomonas sp. F1_0610 TaxID=3114284 RepID=UPI0039C299A3